MIRFESRRRRVVDLDRRHRFLKTLICDKLEGVSRVQCNSSSWAQTAPGDLQKRVKSRFPPVGVNFQEVRGSEAAEIRQVMGELFAKNQLCEINN